MSAAMTLPTNRPEQALKAGGEEEEEEEAGRRRMAVRRGGAAPSQSHGTTQQDNKPSLSLFFFSLHLSVLFCLFLSAVESGKRNLSFHILSAPPLIALDTQSIYLA